MKPSAGMYGGHYRAIAPSLGTLLHEWLVKNRKGVSVSDIYQLLKLHGVVTKPIPLIASEQLSETDQALLVAVASAYGRFTGPQLSTMTHREGTPWKEAYEPNAFDVIPNTLIEKHYTTLLNERAGINPA